MGVDPSGQASVADNDVDLESKYCEGGAIGSNVAFFNYLFPSKLSASASC
jgi:hypothetical protein